MLLPALAVASAGALISLAVADGSVLADLAGALLGFFVEPARRVFLWSGFRRSPLSTAQRDLMAAQQLNSGSARRIAAALLALIAYLVILDLASGLARVVLAWTLLGALTALTAPMWWLWMCSPVTKELMVLMYANNHTDEFAIDE